MPVSGVDSERNYTNYIDKTNSSGKVYNAVFEDKDESDLSVRDFFNLMITQLTNQDFMNPVDDTQYLAQMAQFSTMQEMMDLCQYSKQNYVMGMLGQEVTVSNTKIGGSTENVTGKVDKITIDGNDFRIYINGKPYDYSKVSSISTAASDNNSSDNGKSDAGADKEQKA